MAACIDLPETPTRPARLGFLGAGWIGVNRMSAVAQSGAAKIIAVADTNAAAAQEALRSVEPWTADASVQTFASLLMEELDGVVIATPNGEHAAQSRIALDHGLAVFCQKPLARTYDEALSVVDAARENDQALAVDFCYRHVAGVPEMKALLASGELGEIFAIELVFHNAYGPNKPWFYDVSQSGGGCVLDLGIHLIDLLLWSLSYPRVESISSRLYHKGVLLRGTPTEAEDFAAVELQLESGATARLACSWHLPAGQDAVIEASFYGTRGAARLRNINGSFYDFRVDHCEGTQHRPLQVAEVDWGGVAICDWARRVGRGCGFESSIEQDIEVHRILDEIYRR